MYTGSNYLDIANSWIEQRDWSIKYALEALEDHPLRKVIETKIEELKFNGRMSLNDYKKEQNCTDFTHGKISFKFDEQVMCISSLRGWVWLRETSDESSKYRFTISLPSK